MIVDGHICSITDLYWHNFAGSSQYCRFKKIELLLMLGMLLEYCCDYRNPF